MPGPQGELQGCAGTRADDVAGSASKARASKAAARGQQVECDYDVIVVGAGPAGLSVASELAQKHRVLVVDALPDQPRGRARLLAGVQSEDASPSDPAKIRKSWFCPHDCLYDNPDIVDCRKPNGVTRFLARTYSGPVAEDPEGFDLAWQSKQFEHAALKDRYPYLDEYKLIAHWEQKIVDAGTRSRIEGGCYYQDHHASASHVDVRFLSVAQPNCPSKLYRCRVLLDASGHDSDIRKAYCEPREHVYWWTVCGAICTHPEGDIVSQSIPGHSLVVGDYMLWQTFADSSADPSTPVHRGRPIFEYEILDEHTSFPLVLYLRPHKIPMGRAKAEFLNILHSERTTQAFRNARIREFKFGYYPSARGFRSYAQDRVDFVGDAGRWTTPCGWGASFVLKNYAPYARLLSRLIDEDRLGKASLRSLAKKHAKPAEFFMNTAVTRFLSYGTVQQLDQFIALFNKIDPIVCERIFTLRADPSDLWAFLRAAAREMSVLSLFKAMPKAERMQLLADLAQALAQFGKEGVLRRLGRQPERGFGVFCGN